MSMQWPISCEIKILKGFFKWDKKYGVEIKLKTEFVTIL